MLIIIEWMNELTLKRETRKKKKQLRAFVLRHPIKSTHAPVRPYIMPYMHNENNLEFPLLVFNVVSDSELNAKR